MLTQSRLLLTVGLISLFTCSQAMAWSHAGSWGRSASGGGGSWNASNDRGGSASGGGGSWNAEGARGGSASGGGGSWSADSAQGGSASGDNGRWNATGQNGNTVYGTRYYRPPTTVNRYSTGCYNCGYRPITPAGAAVAGAVVGAATVNAANRNAYYSNSYYDNYNDNGNAYGAGYEAGQASNVPPTGSNITSLPQGCSMTASEAGTYYQCGATWYKPSFGANGVYYTVVPAP